MIRMIEKAGHVYAVTFDEYDVADTITRDGAPLVSTHRDARAILKHADKLAAGIVPPGFTWHRPARKAD